MGGLLVSCMRSVFDTARHFHTPFLRLGDGYIHRQNPTVVLHGGGHTPELEEAVLTPCGGRRCDDEYPTSSAWTQCGSENCLAYSALISSYTRTTPREYRQCVQRILCHESTSADGSCTVLMSPTFHGGSSSLMKPSSPEKVL